MYLRRDDDSLASCFKLILGSKDLSEAAHIFKIRKVGDPEKRKKSAQFNLVRLLTNSAIKNQGRARLGDCQNDPKGKENSKDSHLNRGRMPTDLTIVTSPI